MRRNRSPPLAVLGRQNNRAANCCVIGAAIYCTAIRRDASIKIVQIDIVEREHSAVWSWGDRTSGRHV
jgi:hypothetical protein